MLSKRKLVARRIFLVSCGWVLKSRKLHLFICYIVLCTFVLRDMKIRADFGRNCDYGIRLYISTRNWLIFLFAVTFHYFLLSLSLSFVPPRFYLLLLYLRRSSVFVIFDPVLLVTFYFIVNNAPFSFHCQCLKKQQISDLELFSFMSS